MKNLLRKSRRRSVFFYRLCTSPVRPLPDFIIIGAQKCGTTSLYRYLSGHPLIRPSFGKEVHYFDIHFEKGVHWYRSRFPLLLNGYYAKGVRKRHILTGEASPYYLFHPHAPGRASAQVPEAKLIVLLRNPIDRAYSHYQKNKHETLSFEEAIDREEERLCGELNKMLQDQYYHSFNHQNFSYLSRGIYVDQLKAWESFFDRSQILVLKSEDFFSNPLKVFEQVLDFLNLPRWQPEQFAPHNVGHYSELNAVTRNRLGDYFEPHNQRLYRYLGTELGW